ncbi:MAG: PA0069 family radical SAM protein [Gammaproteobacteria bacterium]|jgi:DNA repair photolyase
MAVESAAAKRKGRAATGNPRNRFHTAHSEALDDGRDMGEAQPAERTTLTVDHSKTVIAYNQSPDVPFDRSLNPYRGCEHGCIYCFARPTHAYLDCSPGLDFETRLFYKPDAAAVLRGELGERGYRCAPLAIGANTDAYQPVERRLGITRAVLEVLAECRHPCALITKSALIERDIDLLAGLAEHRLVNVMVSVTTLDGGLARRMEPRAAAPQRRLETIRRLHAAGIPVGVLVAPLIPVLTDAGLEEILGAARDAGASAAGYILLRLPHEVKTLFADWLQAHYPLKAAHVMNAVRGTRGGRENDAQFGRRMRGCGAYAELLAGRFRLATRRLGFAGHADLDCTQFRPPQSACQPDLFAALPDREG